MKASESVGLHCLFTAYDATVATLDDLARNGNIHVILASYTDTLRHAHRS